MKKTIVTIICLLAVLTGVSTAADISGKWSGDMPGRGGDTMPTSFTFKAEGDKLTGSMTGPQGEIPLQEGKIAGDQISFSTTLDFGGNSIKIVYKGTVAADQIKMTREREGSGQPREFTVKRAGK